ncbi:MAG: hypothetical protein AAF501_09450 [Pseudomonadota bacterium]
MPASGVKTCLRSQSALFPPVGMMAHGALPLAVAIPGPDIPAVMGGSIGVGPSPGIARAPVAVVRVCIGAVLGSGGRPAIAAAWSQALLVIGVFGAGALS